VRGSYSVGNTHGVPLFTPCTVVISVLDRFFDHRHPKTAKRSVPTHIALEISSPKGAPPLICFCRPARYPQICYVVMTPFHVAHKAPPFGARTLVGLWEDCVFRRSCLTVQFELKVNRIAVRFPKPHRTGTFWKCTVNNRGLGFLAKLHRPVTLLKKPHRTAPHRDIL